MVLSSVPVATLSLAGVYSWLAADWRRAVTLGLLPPTKQQQAQHAQRRCGYHSDVLAPFVLHWAFSTGVALLVMHVNVATRCVWWCGGGDGGAS